MSAFLPRAYRQMLRIRKTEEALLSLFAQGLIAGTVHTCLGQEAAAVGVVSALDPARDLVSSNHRGHGHYLAYCDDMRGLIAEVMALPSGICKGIGGSQHIHNRNFYSNGILGGMSPVTVGMALAEKIKGTGAVATVFHGDGALAEGAIYEGFNMASLWSAPVLYAIEHNRYAQSTATALEQSGNLASRATSFGIPVTEVDGNDVEAVYDAAQKIIAQIRADSRPQMLFLHTYRLGPHSKGDDDRDKAELAEHWKKEPLALARTKLGEEVCAPIEREVETELQDCVAALKQEARAA